MVDSLKPEYEGKIKFLIAEVSTQEGRDFAQYHHVGNVTLLFFDGAGKRLSSLTGVQTQDFLRRAFDRAFKIEGNKS